jgi:rod shape-determining protein MreD
MNGLDYYLSRPFGFRQIDFLLLVLLGFFLILGQSILALRIGSVDFVPEWAVPLIIFIVLRVELWVAVLAAFILGFFRDVFGGGPLGFYQLSLIIMTWFFYPFRLRFDFFTPWALMFLVFFFTLGGDFVILILIRVVLGWPGPGFNPGLTFLVSSGISALVAPFLFAVLKRLIRRAN